MSRAISTCLVGLVALALVGLPVLADGPTAEVGARFDAAAQQLFGQLRTEIGSVLTTVFSNVDTSGLNVGLSVAKLVDNDTLSVDVRLNGQASFTLGQVEGFGTLPTSATFAFGLSTDAKLKPVGGRFELAFLGGMDTNGQPLLIPTVSVDLDVGKLAGFIASLFKP